MQTLQQLKSVLDTTKGADKQPLVFIGHGHPINAILVNSFTKSLTELGVTLNTPKAICVVSAHWLTGGTWVTTQAKPATIYDFGRFDDRLFEIKYPAPGAPESAHFTSGLLPGKIYEDQNRGLDHGVWTVLRHVFPKADIPIYQLSLDVDLTPQKHMELANSLQVLRKAGVMVIGSGNLVHNLYDIVWDNERAKPFDWAVEFDNRVSGLLQTQNFNALANFQSWGNLALAAHPTYEHYLPLMYVLGMAHQNEGLYTFHEGIDYASISMRSFVIA